MIKDLLIILISSSLVSNVVLSQFLGLCPFLGVSKKVKTAGGMGECLLRRMHSDNQKLHLDCPDFLSDRQGCQSH